ncbi:MAG: lipid-A-disaccharide synthase, partial [Alphaproteobacteria bacterium]|nr:lipid-A-disaccharide synthase [Alphaproteobacteria bacterium]
MTLRIYIVAGEPSGDALGARLLGALREGGPVEAAGVGGDLMGREGVASLFPQAETAVMGLFEVLPRARRLLRRMDETVADILRFRPDAVVTIDSGGFNKGIARRLITAGCPAARIHYVAPMVWVWAPGRTRAMARLFDHLMTLWPF